MTIINNTITVNKNDNEESSISPRPNQRTINICDLIHYTVIVSHIVAISFFGVYSLISTYI